jgi:hypothetical protein
MKPKAGEHPEDAPSCIHKTRPWFNAVPRCTAVAVDNGAARRLASIAHTNAALFACTHGKN